MYGSSSPIPLRKQIKIICDTLLFPHALHCYKSYLLVLKPAFSSLGKHVLLTETVGLVNNGTAVKSPEFKIYPKYET